MTSDTVEIPSLEISETTSASAVRIVERLNDSTWNEYVDRHPSGSIFHRAEWKKVFDVYHLPTNWLAAVRGKQVVGILPVVRQRSLLFGNQLVSLPWFDAAGVLADDSEAQTALVEQALFLARAERIPTVQLRQLESFNLSPHVRTDKVLMRLSLSDDPQELWKNFSPKVRNQVRKAQKAGLVVHSGGEELLDDFYRVYSTNMRDLGSPAHHREFFQAVFDAFTDESRIHVVRHADSAVGAGFTMANGDCLEIPWASSLRTYNKLCVNHVMYWHILEQACGGSFRRFHFGRSSRDSGTYHFKKQWGAEPVPLYWYFLTPEENVNREIAAPQESFGWATRIWRRLPLRVSQLLGPRIIAKVP